MGSIPLPAALNGLGRLLHLRKPRQWARGARCESQREDHGRLWAPPPRPAESSARTLGSIQAGHASPRLSSRRSRWDKQHRDGEGHPEGGVDRPVERVYEDIYRFGGHPDGGRASARSPGGSAPLSLVCSRTVPLRWPRDRV